MPSSQPKVRRIAETPMVPEHLRFLKVRLKAGQGWLQRVPCLLALACVLDFSTVAGAGVESLAGRFSGAWTNLTFGSTGAASLTLAIDGNQAGVTFDLDGFVFGRFDPPPISIPGIVDGNAIRFSTRAQSFFGDIAGVVDAAAGTFQTVFTNIPGGFIQQLAATGTVGGGVLRLDYLVEFPGPASPQNPAKGVMVVSREAPPRITEIRIEPGALVLEWRGGTPPFQAQSRSQLTSGAWTDVGAPISSHTLRLPSQDSSRLFLRIVGR